MFDENGKYEYKEVKNTDNLIWNKIPDTLYRVILFIAGFIGSFLFSFIIEMILLGVNKDYLNPESAIFIEGLNISNSIRYVILLILLVGLMAPYFKRFIDAIKKYKHILIGLGIGALLIGVTMLYNFIVSLFIKVEVNQNEMYAETLIKAYPAISFFIIGVAGPVCEEITYRFGLFGAIRKKNKILAYIVTFLVFAFIHFDFTGNMVSELLNLPSYLIAGLALSFAYDKFGMECSITAHIVNNMFAIIMTLLAR